MMKGVRGVEETRSPAQPLRLGVEATRVQARQKRERLDPRCVAASLAVHLGVLLGAALLPGDIEPAEIAFVPVELVQETGASGAAGGLAAGSGAAVGGAARPPSATPAANPEARQEAPLATEPPVSEPMDSPPAVAAALPPSPRSKPAIVLPPVPRPALRREPASVEVAEAEPSEGQRIPPAPTALADGAEQRAAPTGTAAGLAEGPAGMGRGSEGAGAGAAGAEEGPGDEYLEKLRRWLARHKNYPKEARRLKQEGTVMVAFVLARDGTVLDVKVERSSGFPLIDQAVIDMLDRASPVPPVPPAYPGPRLSITMPVRFSIGFFGRLF